MKKIIIALLAIMPLLGFSQAGTFGGVANVTAQTSIIKGNTKLFTLNRQPSDGKLYLVGASSIIELPTSDGYVPTSRTLKIKGVGLTVTKSDTALDWSANRSWTITLPSTPQVVGINLSGASANTIASIDGSKNVASLSTSTYPSLTELSRLKGVTSNVQEQFDAISDDIFALYGKALIVSAAPTSEDLSNDGDIRITHDGSFYNRESGAWVNRFSAYSVSNPAGYIEASSVASTYLPKNTAITGATNTKITYDSKGLVTAGTTLSAGDIPTISQSQVTNLTTDLAAKAPILTPTFTNWATSPIWYGGSASTSPITYNSTSAGTSGTGSDHIFKSGSTELARILQNGKFGIGLTSPTSNLEVAVGAATGLGIRASRAGTSSQYAQIDVGDGSYNSLIGNGNGKSLRVINNSSVSGTGTSSDGIAFFVPSTTANVPVQAMQILSNTGNVGIGIVAPVAKLDVYGTGGVLPVSGSTQTVASLALTNAATFSTMYFGAFTTMPYATYVQSSARNDLSVFSAISLNPNGGNVGIGTDAPSGILHAASTTSFVLLCPMTSSQKSSLTGLVAGAEIYCTDCTATDSSTGVKQVYNGSTWKNCW